MSIHFGTWGFCYEYRLFVDYDIFYLCGVNEWAYKHEPREI